MNKGIGGVFYIGWLFIWIGLLYPEMTSRISAIGITGTAGLFVDALVFIFLLIILIIPAYMMLGTD